MTNAWAARHVREPWQYVEQDPPLRDFANLRGDCWTLAMHVQRESFGRRLPDVGGYDTPTDAAGIGAAMRDYQVAEWVQPVQRGDEQAGDLVFLWVSRGNPTHAGTVVERGAFLHLCRGGVRFERYDVGFWARRVRDFWRPCQLLD